MLHVIHASVGGKGMRTRKITLQLALFFLIAVTANIQAQQSRTDELTAKQQEKSKSLHTYTPSRAEGLVIKIQKWGLLSGTGAKGLYPFFGSAFPGGGFAVGAGFRHGVGDTGLFDFHGAYSIAGYQLLDTSLRLPESGSGRLKSTIHAKYQNADEVAFYGIGNDSLEGDKTAFTFIPKQFSLTESLWLSHEFHLGGAIAYLDIDTKPGESASLPSIEEIFSPDEAPGLGTDPQYVTGNLFAEYDWRQSPGWTSRGGFYRVDWYDYNERNGSNVDFHRWDVELVQHFPILRGNQILAFRGLASFTDISSGEIPHFLLPKLGGGSELRGFGDFRFQDRHRMLLTAEYRWTPSKFMDMVIFYETGKVAADTSDLNFTDLHNCYGFGVRFHTPAFTAFRVEVAHSVESTRLILSGGAAF
jgi:hypothetical protein